MVCHSSRTLHALHEEDKYNTLSNKLVVSSIRAVSPYNTALIVIIRSNPFDHLSIDYWPEVLVLNYYALCCFVNKVSFQGAVSNYRRRESSLKDMFTVVVFSFGLCLAILSGITSLWSLTVTLCTRKLRKPLWIFRYVTLISTVLWKGSRRTRRRV